MRVQATAHLSWWGRAGGDARRPIARVRSCMASRATPRVAHGPDKRTDMAGFFSKLLSVGSDKELREFERIASRINELGPTYEAMDDAELSSQTKLFRERLDNGEELDDLLPEAFAAVREASARTTHMRHFDVQLIGGIALHRGMIAEMKTGEGKTLVSTLAGYLNALAGEGVHIVTVNDYLAKRDSEWMGQIYRFMGMEVGLLQNGMRPGMKRPAYAADVTYGTNSEFGFDYLRDNMVTRAGLRTQRGHHYAIVDEVDSILIDEARTPLIISGAGTKSAAVWRAWALCRAERSPWWLRWGGTSSSASRAPVSPWTRRSFTAWAQRCRWES